MIEKSHLKYRKILAGISMPIFLFGLFAPVSITKAAGLVDVVFEINPEVSAEEISVVYGIQPDFVYDAMYTATIDDSTYTFMQSDPRLKYIHLDYPLEASVITTDDDYFTLDANKSSQQWYLPKIQVPEAWEISRGSDDVIVAVLDTGIHARHVELNDGRVIAGYNVLTGKAIPADTNSDDNGHGTAVAGVLGAISDNNKGIAGINRDIKLMPIKALGAEGTGRTSTVARGIVWAADNGANILNLSLGGEGFGTNEALLSAITYAYNKGLFIVAAAGNDSAEHGSNLDITTIYPVCADNVFNMVMGVAATDVNDFKADFSNFGSRCIDISAPGRRIVTTAFLPSEPSNSLLIYGSGTSLAAPMVSGVAALFKAFNTNLSNVELRNLIVDTADNIDDRNEKKCLEGPCAGLIGSGRLNAYNFFKPKPSVNGSLLRRTESREIFLVDGNVKRKISDFVFIQRGYNASQIRDDIENSLAGFSTRDPIPPVEGTLIRSENDPTVYIIEGERKRAISELVFRARGLNFRNIHILPDSEVKSYKKNGDYPIPAGTLIAFDGNPQVYMMHNEQFRRISYFTFQNRKLSFANLIRLTESEKNQVKLANNSWVPPSDGTLLKSENDPSVYLIENGRRKLISHEAFVARKYSFSNVKIIPVPELELIDSGTPVQ